MGRVSMKPKLSLSTEDLEYLRKIANSRNNPLREVIRSKAILAFYEGSSITKIKEITGTSRQTIYEYIDRASSIGVREALKDKYHRPKAPTITEDAKIWVLNIACQKPKDFGYAAELWTYSQLAKHVRTHSKESGYDCLSKAVKATVHRILEAPNIKPHKIKYYLERRDENFEEKMEDILLIYNEIAWQNQMVEFGEKIDVVSLSVDEKPGIQATKNVSPDLMPKIGSRRTIRRDHEYKRLGTVSLLAALNLHNGQVIGQVHDQHRSKEFIELLKEIDSTYPKDVMIRLILDNHSIHRSKETMDYLATVPNRFIYLHTPKHGSWLNLIEMMFSKMSRSFLKMIRVESKEELKERIMLGIKEMNESPVIFKWKNFNPNLSMF